MDDNRVVLQRILRRSLSGKDSHVGTATVLAGLDWKLAGTRPEGAPHSVFQIVNHIVYWEEWVNKWLDGESPKVPKHADGGWPGKVSPTNRKEWEQTVRRFGGVLNALERRSRKGDLLAERGKWTRVEIVHATGSHTTYHVGQVALMRQLLGAWPPPSGGLTW
jgi:uncharacterized damage-inducible protein DinB